MAIRAAQLESCGRRGHLQTIGDAREVDDGTGTELVHHSGPVHLDRLLRGAEFRGNLLVQSARSDQRENLPLPRRQQRQALTEKVTLEIGRASCRERVCQYVWISGVAE